MSCVDKIAVMTREIAEFGDRLRFAEIKSRPRAIGRSGIVKCEYIAIKGFNAFIILISQKNYLR
jgi:hypothetical protein